MSELIERARQARIEKQAADVDRQERRRQEFLGLATGLVSRTLKAAPKLVEGTLTDNTVDFLVDGLFVRYYGWRGDCPLSLVYPCPRCGEQPAGEVGDFKSLDGLADQLDRMEQRALDPDAICRVCTDADPRAVADWAAKKLRGAPAP